MSGNEVVGIVLTPKDGKFLEDLQDRTYYQVVFDWIAKQNNSHRLALAYYVENFYQTGFVVVSVDGKSPPQRNFFLPAHHDRPTDKTGCNVLLHLRTRRKWTTLPQNKANAAFRFRSP